MKEIISSSHFENICRNFNINRDMQKGIKENIFNEDNLLSPNGKIAKFYLWDKDPKNFNPQKLVGTWKLTKKNFNIKICGTLSERIKQLRFISKMFKNRLFLINEVEFKIDSNKEEEEKFNNLLNKYIDLDNFFHKHNILKDVNFDNWEDNDFNKLFFWITAIENKKVITLNSNISLVGSVNIKNIRLSVFAKITIKSRKQLFYDMLENKR